MQQTKIYLMVDIMNDGSIETKINCTKLLEMLMDGKISEDLLFFPHLCLSENLDLRIGSHEPVS